MVLLMNKREWNGNMVSSIYGTIYHFATTLLMYIYRKATKVQVKILLKTTLQKILSMIILISISSSRYFFLILVCLVMTVWKNLPAKIRIIEKPVNWFVLQISWVVSIWYKFLLKGIFVQRLVFSYMKNVLKTTAFLQKLNKIIYVPFPFFVLCK